MTLTPRRLSNSASVVHLAGHCVPVLLSDEEASRRFALRHAPQRRRLRTAGLVDHLLVVRVFCRRYAAVGVGVQTVSAFITCITTAHFSAVGVSIAGPDIIAALFFQSMAAIIAEEVRADADSSPPPPCPALIQSALQLLVLGVTS